MISCTEFIPAYSELFRYLEERGGKQEVVAYWEYISDSFLHNLRQLVAEHGLRGCWMYWSHTLNEEAADFTMEIDDEAGEFRITMHQCPSRGLLNALEHMEPYHDYCGHCDVLYRRILEPMGFECFSDHSECDQARCVLIVRSHRHDTPSMG
ncbi:MAG: hypothetical protein GX358_00970 [candidate division WS1 bacterium]|jgi:hypothetical protein|nr:hypothetical protein [candidate division WS1 bacterium]